MAVYTYVGGHGKKYILACKTNGCINKVGTVYIYNLQACTIIYRYTHNSFALASIIMYKVIIIISWELTIID